jgi:CheY-like chemotaxis protein
MEPKHATVLIVDDEATLLDIFREWLEGENLRVLTAGDGAAALRVLDNQHADAIITDVRMPVMDGILLLKNLATLGVGMQGIHTPKMLLISGSTDLEPREAYNLGVEALLPKPIKREQFVDAVRRALRTPEEKWSVPSPPSGLQWHVALPSPAVAIEQGRIAFGRGGFCVRCTSQFPGGPVRFDLEFEAETVNFAGHGLIRWADPDEHVLGVEISYLDVSCREWAIRLLTLYASSSYIPRAPLSAVPRIRIAR